MLFYAIFFSPFFFCWHVELFCLTMLFLLYKFLLATQDLEKEELPSHMTPVSAAEIKRVSDLSQFLFLCMFFMWVCHIYLAEPIL